MSARRTWIAVAGLTLLALVLRLLRSTEGLFADELFTRTVTAHGSLADVVSDVASDIEITPPLYFVLSWLASKLGDSELLLRLPSLVAGTLCVPLTYAIGLRLVGRRPALIAAGLLAVAPFAVMYGAEARAYSLATMLCLTATFALLEATRSGNRWWWVAFSASTAGALYSHYTTVFVLAALIGWAVATHPAARRRLALAVAAAALAFAPWVPEFLDDRAAGFQEAIGTVWPFTASFVGESLVRWIGGDEYQPLDVVPGTVGLVLLGIGVLAATAGLVEATRRRRITLSAPIALVVLLAAAAPVGTVAYSLLGTSIFVSRTLLSSLPFLMLVIGLAIASARRPVAIGAAAALNLAAFAGIARQFDPDNRRPATNRVARWIDERRSENATLVYGPFDFGLVEASLKAPFELYTTGCKRAITAPGQLMHTPGLCATDTPPTQSLAAARGRRYFVVSSNLGPVPAAAELLSHRATETAVFRGSPPFTVALYEPR